ncbi:TIGR03089 family protein [Corynebacterium urealyticum]|uniref:TIGR03089 family protein n=1 Tax=Corynebacterium urealyticum TaxID=43771 RepID=UPI00293F21BE|nr:TIGR03089 family protein [Corynebacterium urealyticum]WOH94836.1 TIGR03089 family protein [Corynebacterium urealyticum]
MDALSALLNDPAAPRLTTYTDAGRMELSAQTLQNWQSKVANLLLDLGAGPGSVIVCDAEPGWQPVTIAVGAWLIGATVVDARGPLPDSLSDAAAPPVAAFTDSVELAEQLADEGLGGLDAVGGLGDIGELVEEVFVLSTDPFGRGVTESGGELPFGLNDFSPELRVQPDAFLGTAAPADEGRVLAASGGEQLTEGQWLAGNKHSDGDADGERVIFGPWNNAVQLAETVRPWAAGGAVVMSTDATPERLAELAASENARPVN